MTDDLREDSLHLVMDKKAGAEDFDFEMTASSPRAAVHGIANAITYIARELEMAPQEIVSVVAAVLFKE